MVLIFSADRRGVRLDTHGIGFLERGKEFRGYERPRKDVDYSSYGIELDRQLMPTLYIFNL